jgi:ankyrin repeat protein
MSIPEYAIQRFFDGASQGNLRYVEMALDEYRMPINYRRAGDGVTALIMAAVNYRDRIVQYLINRGANLNIQTKNSDATALIAAAATNSNGAVDLLVDAGADLDKQDKFGKTAIMHTIRWLYTGHGYAMFKKLLRKGASTSIKDNSEKSLVDYIQEELISPEDKQTLINMTNNARENKKTSDPKVQAGGKRRRRTRRHR